ncbi:Lipase-3 domain-containing protein [Mycena indigotica]|uniref:Lipase-3 domain-containing protein n=1 Tax=Mycena indigotica TaxID=2126181 RepID=A0A8H6RZ93_9AGAR|nr:Lipase-3 domain-containing protein [Mycena indigotica]KAF7288972.1 Lipase-3 domain-containing protein [Mycena indigotica]
MFPLPFLLTLLPSALAAPISIFGFQIGAGKQGTAAPAPISLATVNATLLRPAQFARAAYCPSASITSWTCGLPCQQLKGVKFLQSGGDQGAVPFYFIAHDTVENTLVVAHEGTDPSKFLSLLNDAEFALTAIDTKRIPNAAGKGIKVHDGFQNTFQRTADGLLAGVQKNLASTGVQKVVVTGHSLGAAIATMTAAMLRAQLPSNIQVATTTFGMPRGGNQAWADYLDSTLGVTFVTNQHDPVPIVPPLLFGFKHPSGEVHIVDSTQQNIVSCPGQDNKQCISANSLLKPSISNHLGPYFNNLSFGGAQCS